jgi:hypothetical protein
LVTNIILLVNMIVFFVLKNEYILDTELEVGIN